MTTTVTQIQDRADAAAFREGLAQMVTSVSVITTTIDGKPHGFTANSMTSVSMDPPLVLFCLADKAECHDSFLDAEVAAINVLAEGQSGVSTTFATRGADKFGAAEFRPGRTGAPVLSGAAVSLEGTITGRWPTGDHTVFVMEVRDVGLSGSEPLTYQGRRFRELVREAS